MGHALEGNLHLIFNQSFKDATEMARPTPTRTPTLTRVPRPLHRDHNPRGGTKQAANPG